MPEPRSSGPDPRFSLLPRAFPMPVCGHPRPSVSCDFSYCFSSSNCAPTTSSHPPTDRHEIKMQQPSFQRTVWPLGVPSPPVPITTIPGHSQGCACPGLGGPNTRVEELNHLDPHHCPPHRTWPPFVWGAEMRLKRGKQPSPAQRGCPGPLLAPLFSLEP